MADITIFVALIAGLGSFVAPCILPMIPAFLAYISGTTVTELRSKDGSVISVNRMGIILNTVFFVLGFSVVFSALGVLINSVISSAADNILQSLNYVGGTIIISGTLESQPEKQDVKSNESLFVTKFSHIQEQVMVVRFIVVSWLFKTLTITK